MYIQNAGYQTKIGVINHLKRVIMKKVQKETVVCMAGKRTNCCT